MDENKAPREWKLGYSAGLMNGGRPEDLVLGGDPAKLKPSETVRVIEYAAFIKSEAEAQMYRQRCDGLFGDVERLEQSIKQGKQLSDADNRRTVELERECLSYLDSGHKLKGDLACALTDLSDARAEIADALAANEISKRLLAREEAKSQALVEALQSIANENTYEGRLASEVLKQFGGGEVEFKVAGNPSDSEIARDD